MFPLSPCNLLQGLAVTFYFSLNSRQLFSMPSKRKSFNKFLGYFCQTDVLSSNECYRLLLSNKRLSLCGDELVRKEIIVFLGLAISYEDCFY